MDKDKSDSNQPAKHLHDRDEEDASQAKRSRPDFGQPQSYQSSPSAHSKLPSELESDEYNMAHDRRGYAIIVNNINFIHHGKRQGAERDSDVMKKFFKDLGFEVKTYEDQTVQEMRKIFTEYKKGHAENDCFACAIMSHGDDGGIILGKNGGTIKIDDITKNFKGDNCPTLVGKPKIFIIQACRGKKLDKGAGGNVADGPILLPEEADVLLAYSGVPGFKAWRNPALGSYFIQAFGYMYEKYADEMDKIDFVKFLTRVSKKVAYDFQSNTAGTQFKQMPCIHSQLTKDIYFKSKK